MINENEKNLTEEEQEVEQNFGLSDSFIKEVAELLDEDDFERLHDLCDDLPPEDMVELIMKLSRSRRQMLVEVLGDSIDPETFSYFEKEILNDLMEHLAPAHIASIINELESDDALGIIEDLDEDRRGAVFRYLNKKLRMAVEEGLSFPEESAGRIMQHEVVAVPQFWTVGKTIDYLRAAGSSLPEKFYNIFVIDSQYKVLGEVDLSTILHTARNIKVENIMSEEFVIIPVNRDQHDVAILFRRKDLLSAAVVDDEGHLMGVITIDDIVDVIHEEAEKEILQLSGVNDQDIHLQVMSTVGSRFIWLAINLVTAFIASAVVGMFEGTIAKLATLAVLMPIVAGMGGNAGTQTLAVTVRALSSNEISSVNVMRSIFKECAVGFINGILFSIIIGSIVFFWFNDLHLGMVIAASMIINLFLAGFSGSIIPIVMDKMGADPAQSSGVFLTTVTDVAGFFSFLGLATWFLI